MNKNVIRNLVYSRVSFFGAMAICIVLSQRGITDNQGLSYYGTSWSTLIPYALGFILTAFFVFRATFAITIEGFEGTFLIVTLRTVALLLLGVLATPYAVNMDFYHIHVAVSSLLFFIEFIMTGWLTIYVRADWVNRGLAVVVFASGIVAFLSLNSTLRYMVAAQLVYELCFALILLRSVKTLVVRASHAGSRNPSQ